MVNLLTGPKGSGKTQQMIELANQAAKVSNGNVVLIKKSHRDTYSVDFSIRVICMDDYKMISNIDEFKGFLYGMVAGNQVVSGVNICSVVARVQERRGRDAHMNFRSTGIAKQRYNSRTGCTTDDGIIHQNHPLAPQFTFYGT